MADYSLGTAHGQIVIDADTSGVDRANTAMGTLGKGSQSATDAANKLGTGMMVAGGVIAGGLGLAAKTAMDFQQELSNVASVGGKQAVERMGEIHDKALDIGKSTTFGATEAAQAMEELAKAGIPVNDILNGVADATVSLAAATGVDMPTAATLASTSMNMFGLKADQATQTVDILAQAANASSIDVADLGMGMQQAGAVAHLVGMSFGDTAKALGELGSAGIKGSDAGTSLKTMLMNLQPTTKKAATQMQELGLITKDGSNQFFDAQGNVKSLRDVQELLHTSLKGMTKQQKEQALATMFGSDAMRASAILADKGAAGYDNFGQSMHDAGTAQEQAKIRMDNAKGSIENLKGSLENAGISIGETLIPAISALAGWLGTLFDWINGLPGPLKTMLTWILAGTAAFLLIGGAGLKLVKQFQEIGGAISTLITWLFRKNVAETESAAVSERSAIASALAWAKSAAETVILWVWYTAQAAVNAVKAGAVWVAQSIASATQTAAAWAVGVAKTVAQWVIMAASATANAIKVGAVWIAQTVAAGTEMAVQWAIATAKTIAQWVIMGAQAALNAAKVAAAWLIANGTAIATALASMAVAVATTLAGWVTMAIEATVNALIIAASWLIAFWPVVLIIAIIALVVAAVIIFWDQIVAAFKAAWDWIKKIMQGIWDAIKAAWDGVVGAFKAAGQAIWDAVVAAWNWVKSTWDTIINFLKQIPGWIAGVFAAAASWLINAGKNILEGLWNGLKSIWNTVLGWVKGIGGWIIGALGDAGSWLVSVGRNILEGLWNGISGAASWLWGKVKGWAMSIFDGIKSLFGIGSPSKLFRDEVGKWLPKGLAVGIDMSTKDAVAEAKAMTDAVVASVSMSGPSSADFWDGTALGVGSVPPSSEVASYAASQGVAPTTNITTNIYNPTVEDASDSEARRLRTLSALGAF